MPASTSGRSLELILIIANIGTAIVLITLLKRQHEILTFSYVGVRIMEWVFILVGILAVLAIVTLSQQDAGGDEGAIAYTLAEIKGRSSSGPAASRAYLRSLVRSCLNRDVG
jgi:hypothetical protein